MNHLQSLRRAARLLSIACLSLPGAALASSLSVDVWSDRGDGSVYRPDESIEIGVRANDDAFMLVYEIDSEGYVHVLYPHEQRTPFVEGRTTLRLPEGDAERLAVQGPVGEGYIVAIASREPFRTLPWYLRPYDPQAEELGYHGGPGDESDLDGKSRPPRDSEGETGVTAEGRIVGDPFVGMERIRRAVLGHADDGQSFATAYTSYYVHQAVRYPRYLCYDCHRPGYWSWWSGFDPYYATCSAFDFRVNASWWWGPTYWFGAVPHYVFVYRDHCPPRYAPSAGYPRYWSSWDGWQRWRRLWGGPLRRTKSAPPPGYIAPDKFDRAAGATGDRRTPPGFMANAHGWDDRGTGGFRRDRNATPDTRRERGANGNGGLRDERRRVAPSPGRTPANVDPRDRDGAGSGDRPARETRERPSEPRRDAGGNWGPGGSGGNGSPRREEPRREEPRREAPRRIEPRHEEPRREEPRREEQRERKADREGEVSRTPDPRPETPRESAPAPKGGWGGSAPQPSRGGHGWNKGG